MGTIGIILYWVGPFAGNPMIGLVGMGLGGVGTVTAGVLFGTDDRDFYL